MSSQEHNTSRLLPHPKGHLRTQVIGYKAEAPVLPDCKPKGVHFTVVLYIHVVLSETVLFQFLLPHNDNPQLKGFEVPGMVSTTSITLVDQVNILSDK